MTDPSAVARMESALLGVQEKLKWAGEHTRELANLVNAWLKENPYGLRSDFYPAANVVAVSVATPNLPPRFGVMAGNVVYQLRSILDHLVWQLVIANGKTPNESNQFPIFTPDRPKPIQNAAHFDQVVRDGVLQGVASDHRAAIEMVQPYHRTDWKSHPLAVLQALNNIDKHRLPLAAVHRGDPNYPSYMVLGSADLVEDIESFNLAALLAMATDRLYEGAVIAVYEVVPNGPNPKVHMHAQATRYVTFAETDDVPLISGIYWLAEAVAGIVTCLSPAIANAANSVVPLFQVLLPFRDQPKPVYEGKPLNAAELIFGDFFTAEDSE